MRTLKTGAFALALSAAMSGCASMPAIPPVNQSAEEATGIGEPFEFLRDREALDVSQLRGVLTLEDASKLALKHDPAIQSALARVRQAQGESEQTRLWPNPVMSVALRLPETGGKPVIEASVAAELLSLLTKPGRISAADNRLRKSTAEALTTVLDTLVDVQTRYSKAQSLAAQVKIDEARQGILGELVTLTEARLRAGEAARLDVLTVQSELATLRTELVSLRSQERQARLRLARLVGEPSSALNWNLEAWEKPATIPDDEPQWIKLALEHRPELRAVVWELAALGQELRITQLSPFDGGEVGIDGERDGEWTIGPAVAVPLPIFDFGQAQRQIIDAKTTEQKHELTKLERLIVEQVRVSFEQLQSARTALEQAEQELIPLQEQRLTQARNGYRAGLADVLAVRIAEADLQQARANQVELQDQVSQAHFELMRAVGGRSFTSKLPTTVPNLTTQPSSEKE